MPDDDFGPGRTHFVDEAGRQRGDDVDSESLTDKATYVIGLDDGVEVGGGFIGPVSAHAPKPTSPSTSPINRWRTTCQPCGADVRWA